MARQILKLICVFIAFSVFFPCNANASDKQTSFFSVAAFYGSNARGFDIGNLNYKKGDQKLIGAAVGWTPINATLDLKLGIEAGVATRDDGDTYGEGGTSQEIWFGPRIRHTGLKLGPILIKPAVTVGFSYVTESNGLERAREIRDNGNARFIYYGGPELGLSLRSKPNLELVGRIHHRSGAGRVSYMPTIGNIGDSNNVSLIGIRYRFD